MGLLSVLRKARAQDREARILLVGLDAAGKSTVVAALEANAARRVSSASSPSDDPAPPPRQVAPTLGFEIRTLELGG
jgi:GTPase SAR1 family protein